MIAAAASTAGIGGIVVRPAPSRAPRSRFEEVEEVPSRPVTLEPESARADPSAVEASRLDARDTVDELLPIPAGWLASGLSAARCAVLPANLGVVLPADRAGLPEGPAGEPQTSQ